MIDDVDNQPDIIPHRMLSEHQITKYRKILSIDITAERELFGMIIEDILSGCLPAHLTYDEMVLLMEIYGKEWYKLFDYIDEDMFF